MRRSIIALALALAAACAQRPRADDDDDGASTAQSAQTSSTDGAGGSTTSTTSGRGSGGAAPTMPFCQVACASAADCSMGSPPYDADNYSCPDDYCVYEGCNSTSECQSLGNYQCLAYGTTMLCQEPCASASDCTLGTPAYDLDNWACQQNACVWLGCNSDSECQSLGNYLCREAPGGTLKNCFVACTTPADCDLGTGPAFDADNYSCNDGYCVYQGCNSDSECQSLGNYVCR